MKKNGCVNDHQQHEDRRMDLQNSELTDRVIYINLFKLILIINR